MDFSTIIDFLNYFGLSRESAGPLVVAVIAFYIFFRTFAEKPILAIKQTAGEKFSKIENDIEWIKKSLNEIKIGSDNKNTGAFATHSPVSLTDKGQDILNQSGMRVYVDLNKDLLLGRCESLKDKNAYRIQQDIFDTFDTWKFPDEEYKKFQQFSFDKGVSMEIIRRVGAIYFRDICLEKFGHRKEDIDKHDPQKITLGEK